MHTIIEVADAARKELRRDPLPEACNRPATYRLAQTMGAIISLGHVRFQDAFWVSVYQKLGHKVSIEDADYCSVDMFLWVCGFSTNVAQLAQKPVLDHGKQKGQNHLPPAEHAPESEVIEMVLRVCDAIVPSNY